MERAEYRSVVIDDFEVNIGQFLRCRYPDLAIGIGVFLWRDGLVVVHHLDESVAARLDDLVSYLLDIPTIIDDFNDNTSSSLNRSPRQLVQRVCYQPGRLREHPEVRSQEDFSLRSCNDIGHVATDVRYGGDDCQGADSQPRKEGRGANAQ